MDSQKVLYNKTGDDEQMTPEYGVTPILKYIPKGFVVWCPSKRFLWNPEDRGNYWCSTRE